MKLWLGFPPERSGVFSAGNGPVMRSPVLGAAIEDVDMLRPLVRASSRLTHTDPKAEYGAMAVALASRMASTGGPVQPAEFMEVLRHVLVEEPAKELIDLVEQALAILDEPTPSAAAALGLERGVSGYTYHTVPICLHAWLRNQRDYAAAVMGVIRCGGDTDSTAAIVGGIVGSAVGRPGIPAEWLDALWEWPRTVAWMEELGTRLAAARQTSTTSRPPRLPLYGILPRNLFFLAIVLTHGFRRLLPPY
jgi:ADP-ribosylglycohydrolase